MHHSDTKQQRNRYMGHIKQEAFSYSRHYTTRSPTNYKNENCFFKSPVPFFEPILKFEVMIKEHHSYKLNGDIQLMATYMNCVQLINTWNSFMTLLVDQSILRGDCKKSF